MRLLQLLLERRYLVKDIRRCRLQKLRRLSDLRLLLSVIGDDIIACQRLDSADASRNTGFR